MVSELNDRGFNCSENTVAKLMRELGIEARRAKPFKPKTTKVDHAAKYSSNKLESQHASRFGETLVSDITYIRTKRLALSGRCDGSFFTHYHWSPNGGCDACRNSNKKLRTRRFGLDVRHQSSRFHSDRGTQYTSQKLREASLLHSAWINRCRVREIATTMPVVRASLVRSKRELMPDSGYFETRREAGLLFFSISRASTTLGASTHR
ncbi:IS3 family transposase [Rubritalea tangerina]|uniref:IS3 family transposase n=1 Tax=Rubritalea tangerina TaxID=430798 RepID=UPI0036130A3D